MSWDINIKAKREVNIYEANITYNLADMYYKCLDKKLGLKIFLFQLVKKQYQY